MRMDIQGKHICMYKFFDGKVKIVINAEQLLKRFASQVEVLISVLFVSARLVVMFRRIKS